MKINIFEKKKKNGWLIIQKFKMLVQNKFSEVTFTLKAKKIFVFDILLTNMNFYNIFDGLKKYFFFFSLLIILLIT